jgi:phage shock protein C
MHANQPSASPPAKRLQRSEDRKVAGVCGGVAEYFGVDPTIVRLLFVAGLFLGAGSLVVYLAAWALMPEGPKAVSTVEAPVPRPATPPAATPPAPADRNDPPPTAATA